MVCIAAFIILALVGVVVAFLSIFNRELGRKYLSVMKKAWHCVFKKVRLQKCDTNFKDDVKTTLLKKVILKHPKWVKPLSALIEILSVLIVLITVWSIIIAIKSLLALWVFGTCNVSQPSQCSLGAEACTIDQGEPTNLVESIGRGFGEWGQIFGAIPDRLKTWEAKDYLPRTYLIEESAEEKPLALDIIDPLCSVCMQSYKNQHSNDFASSHTLVYILYAIPDAAGGYKFKNSGTIVRYLYAPYYYSIAKLETTNPTDLGRILSLHNTVALSMLNRIFTEETEQGINWQSALSTMDEAELTTTLKNWYIDFGYTAEEAAEISTNYTTSAQITDLMSEISTIVTDKVHAKGIPTIIYDGKKHNGLYKL